MSTNETSEAARLMGRRGGSKTSEAKRIAVRANGAKGGRPIFFYAVQSTGKAADSGERYLTRYVRFASEDLRDAWVAAGGMRTAIKAGDAEMRTKIRKYHKWAEGSTEWKFIPLWSPNVDLWGDDAETLADI